MDNFTGNIVYFSQFFPFYLSFFDSAAFLFTKNEMTFKTIVGFIINTEKASLN